MVPLHGCRVLEPEPHRWSAAACVTKETSTTLSTFTDSTSKRDPHRQNLRASLPVPSFPLLQWTRTGGTTDTRCGSFRAPRRQTGGVYTVFPHSSGHSVLKGTPINVKHLVKQQAGQFLVFFFFSFGKYVEGSEGVHIHTLVKFCLYTVQRIIC